MRKIIIASDSFKGSLTSRQVGEAASRGIAAVMPEAVCEIVPVADGGEGTVESVVSALGGELISVVVTDPIGKPVEAVYGVCGETAVIEMAAASGLPLVAEEDRNPLITTSFGTGELIRDALKRGCKKILIGIGGSATNDAGVGMLCALGFRFTDAEGKDVGRRGGGELSGIVKIDSSGMLPQLKDVEFIVASDVDNPLTGPRGASMVFSMQKGADEEMATLLDKSLESFAKVVVKENGKDFSDIKGAGAAGGMGFAFLSFLNARMEKGIEMVLEAVDFDSKLSDADLVITGEGRMDMQTIMGKTPFGVMTHAHKSGVPVIAICGSVESEAVTMLLEEGFRDVVPIVKGEIDLKEALKKEVASKNVEQTVANILSGYIQNDVE
ncbi:MAG: glycerate kinase [Muribaculaceae bacterium]|nr:glycerate kinase [Muribaculaceae bacterium]